MRRRFRKPKGGDGADSGAPDGPDGLDGSGGGGGAAFDRLLERQLDERADMAVLDIGPETGPDIGPENSPDIGLDAGADYGADTGFGTGLGVGRDTDGADWAVGRPPAGGDDFWDRYDQAAAEAALASVTPAPASVVAVVGPLDAAMSVARRQIGPRHVHVLTEHRDLPAGCDGLDWTRVERPSDLVAVLDQAVEPNEEHHGVPILVLDVPSELPAFVEPLVARLRQCGLGLVHYVLDGDPDDEDLATWYGRLGRPSVLDLVTPLEPVRILELIDRGEPVVSVAGRSLTPELLLALRLDVGHPADGDLVGRP